jgi:hypothetical protein
VIIYIVDSAGGAVMLSETALFALTTADGAIIGNIYITR